ncbi:MAG: hypothetical protein GEV12_01505 [Micromonosporaceae bacterium]|nr:hypothetical protein [Micromonosporaceae bacterium]
MKERLRDLVFPGFLLALALIGLNMSMDWGFRTRLFPMIATLALATFAAAEIVNVLVRRPRPALDPAPEPGPPSATTAAPGPIPENPTPEKSPEGGETTAPAPVVVTQAQARATGLGNEPSFDLKATLIMVVWLAAYTGALYLLGFLVAGVVLTFAYMTLGRREGWRPAALMAAGVGLVVWVLQTYAGLRVADGLLWGQL